ncbi:MAG: acyltransferase [Chitinivibrionales bacterium]|nr:acyltransferase [Chitinivibrionales bacterium]
MELLYNKLILWFFNVKYKKFPTINGKIYLKNSGTIKLGKNIIINSKLSTNPISGQGKSIIIVKSGAELLIKDGTGISNSIIICSKNIYIGSNVCIGAGCKIYDTDFHSVKIKERLSPNNPGTKTAPVRIESGAFIGADTIILKGVTIGKNSVVGAGAVVTKDIPDNEIWAGNPAKFIKKIDNAIPQN